MNAAATRPPSLWFTPRMTPRTSRLLAALPSPADARAAVPSPPAPPSAAEIMRLVRRYGDVLVDGRRAFDKGEDLHCQQALHKAHGLLELIEHNVSILEGWITGYRLIASDLGRERE